MILDRYGVIHSREHAVTSFLTLLPGSRCIEPIKVAMSLKMLGSREINCHVALGTCLCVFTNRNGTRVVQWCDEGKKSDRLILTIGNSTFTHIKGTLSSYGVRIMHSPLASAAMYDCTVCNDDTI
jgi:hypothetical protein